MQIQSYIHNRHSQTQGQHLQPKFSDIGWYLQLIFSDILMSVFTAKILRYKPILTTNVLRYTLIFIANTLRYMPIFAADIVRSMLIFTVDVLGYRPTFPSDIIRYKLIFMPRIIRFRPADILRCFQICIDIWRWYIPQNRLIFTAI